MSFAAELVAMSDATPIDDKKTTKDDVRDKLFTALTDKYLLDVRNSLLRAAHKGFREKYINFTRDDFKANFAGLGTPAEVQRGWLIEMCDPESKYMKKDDEGNCLTLQGIDADVWNNVKFTTHFKW